jgi:hypothetical protein
MADILSSIAFSSFFVIFFSVDSLITVEPILIPFDSKLDKNLNVGSLDLSGEYTNDILSSIRRKPAVNEDRVSLLLQDLKKYNLL